MPELRAALVEAGFADVATHVQSGNVVLSSDLPEAEIAERGEHVIRQRFGFEVDCVVRSREDLEAVVAHDPFARVAADPKRYLCLFFRQAVPGGLAERMERAADPSEAFAIRGREVYLWLPASVQRSRLWTMTSGVPATARNWNTVLAVSALLG